LIGVLVFVLTLRLRVSSICCRTRAVSQGIRRIVHDHGFRTLYVAETILVNIAGAKAVPGARGTPKPQNDLFDRRQVLREYRSAYVDFW
jgi:hypothetical protein